MAVPRSGRRSIRPTANFSRPRDSSHRLSSNIKALGTVYHTGEGRIGGAAKREEVDPTDSQLLQAQGHLTSFAIRHRGPGHSISRRWEGELAVPRSGRRSFRPTANFSRPRDILHRLPSGIEALGKYTIKNLRWAICSPQVWLGWLESNQHAQSQSLLSYH